VHVEADRGGGSVGGEPARLARGLREVQARAAKLLRQRHPQIARAAKILEVFLKEAILAIVNRGPVAAFLEQRFGQHTFGRYDGRHTSSSPRIL